MSHVKDEAEALAIALESDAIDVEEVIAWADKLIEQLDQPDWTLCQVALASKKTAPEVIRLLQQIQGCCNERVVMREVFQFFKKKLASATTYTDANKIAKKLFMMAAYEDAIEDSALRDVSLWAWDQMDLAEQGYVSDTVERIVSQIQNAIDHALDSSWLKID